MRHGEWLVVGKGEKGSLDPTGLKNLLCLSMEAEEWFSQGIVLHLDIRPLDSISKP
jgi:hypothetical protein